MVEKEISAEDLKVGDVIRINNGLQVPTDCVVLQTDDPLGQCYINTAQLDGERNLKPKFATKLTQGLLHDLKLHQISIQAMNPHKDIYKFEGTINNENAKIQNPVDLKSFIPRGASV